MSNTDAFHSTLEALRAERQALADKIRKVDHAIEAIEDLVAAPGRPSGGVTVSVSAKLPTGEPDPTYVDAVAQVLRERGTTTHIDELLLRFKAKGWFRDKDMASRSFRNSVLGSIDRKVRDGDTFFKAAPATYGLRDWNTKNTTPPAGETAEGASTTPQLF